MTTQAKTISEINRKLQNGSAVVMTAMEFKELVRAGKTPSLAEVDVVTTATRGVMSGTAAMLTLPLREVGSIDRITRLHLNGVPCLTAFPVCAERGLVEVILNGTQESVDNFGRYGGGHVMRALAERQAVEVEYVLVSGRKLRQHLTLDDMPFARIYTSRNSFQNYMGFTNAKDAPSYRALPFSIFACRPIAPLGGMAVSGSGEMNPGANDPSLQVIRPGIRILVNGAQGTMIGYGTRAQKGHVCFSTMADMRDMDPQYMGGFRTSCGVEITSSLAVPFPILNQTILDGLASCLDENLTHNVGDFSDRVGIGHIPYSEIWKDAPLEVEFDFDRCVGCSFQCEAEYYCPMNAISWKDKTIDQSLCVACGACTGNCLGGAFMGAGRGPGRGVGEIRLFGKLMPIIFRQSNRLRSERLAEELKRQLVEGSFRFLQTDAQCRLW